MSDQPDAKPSMDQKTAESIFLAALVDAAKRAYPEWRDEAIATLAKLRSEEI